MLRPTSVTTWTVALQALLFMRFPRQEYWRGLPFSFPFMCLSHIYVAKSLFVLLDMAHLKTFHLFLQRHKLF